MLLHMPRWYRRWRERPRRRSLRPGMSTSLESGGIVGGYRIESLLGRGGMAAVYLAEDGRLKRKVALKVLSPELAADEAFRRRFVDESERLASVDHPNIIPIYEAGQDDGHLFIAMRYVDSTDLKELIASEGHLSPERAVSIVTQVAGALDAAHAKGLVHRDVKPANVLVAVGSGGDGSDHAYLSDFGLTKRTQETSGLTKTGFFMGSIDYVAPEQISGKSVDGRTDQYALACVLFQCLTGRTPYPRDDDAAVLFSHLSEPPPSVTGTDPDLPPAIDAVLARAMAKEQDDRYGSCLEFARAARTALLQPSGAPAASRTSAGDAVRALAHRDRSTRPRRGATAEATRPQDRDRRGRGDRRARTGGGRAGAARRRGRRPDDARRDRRRSDDARRARRERRVRDLDPARRGVQRAPVGHPVDRGRRPVAGDRRLAGAARRPDRGDPRHAADRGSVADDHRRVRVRVDRPRLRAPARPRSNA